MSKYTKCKEAIDKLLSPRGLSSHEADKLDAEEKNAIGTVLHETGFKLVRGMTGAFFAIPRKRRSDFLDNIIIPHRSHLVMLNRLQMLWKRRYARRIGDDGMNPRHRRVRKGQAPGTRKRKRR